MAAHGAGMIVAFESSRIIIARLAEWAIPRTCVHAPVPLIFTCLTQERGRLRAVPGSTCVNPNVAASTSTPATDPPEGLHSATLEIAEGAETASATLRGGKPTDSVDEVPCLVAAGQPGSDGVCEYVAVPPTPGTFVVFPGWLLHAVLPATHPDVSACLDECNDHDRGTKLDEDGGELSTRLPRISVAFNYEPPV